MVIKIIVYGLMCNGQNSYLMNGWNVLDCFIVIVSIILIVIEDFSDDSSSATTSNLELLKMLRILRSIRLISKSDGLKTSVISIVNSVPDIIRVTMIVSLCFLIFGIFFQNILKGRLYYCHFDESIVDRIDLNKVESMYDCVNSGGTWRNSDFNFDSILSST